MSRPAVSIRRAVPEDQAFVFEAVKRLAAFDLPP